MSLLGNYRNSLYLPAPSRYPRSRDSAKSPSFPRRKSRAVSFRTQWWRAAPWRTTFTLFAVALGAHHDANVPRKGNESSFFSSWTAPCAEIYLISSRVDVSIRPDITWSTIKISRGLAAIAEKQCFVAIRFESSPIIAHFALLKTFLTTNDAIINYSSVRKGELHINIERLWRATREVIRLPQIRG